MVQLHAVHAGLAVHRATDDIDVVLHVETGATTFAEASRTLSKLGYRWVRSLSAEVPPHRFMHPDTEQVVDVMIADHVPPKVLGNTGRVPFQVPGGTQALTRTVDAVVATAPGQSVTVSLPGPLAALVLKGAAYLEDARDRGRLP